MNNDSVRLIIRNILLEFTPDYKKKEYFDVLGKGIRMGRGEKPDLGKKGKQDFKVTQVDNEWRNYFKKEFEQIKDDGNYDPNKIDNSTKTSAMLNKMDRYLDSKLSSDDLFAWNKKYENQVIKDYKSIRNQSLKSTVSDCYDAFYNFLSEVRPDEAYDFQWIGRKDA